MKAGQPVDPVHGQRGKQRSVHNTYFTLPVLFVMISSHHAMTFGSRWGWLVLVALTVAGALIRTAQAASLLGTQVLLTGISPEIAQTLVGIGIDLKEIITKATLQEGIAYALKRRTVSFGSNSNPLRLNTPQRL